MTDLEDLASLEVGRAAIRMALSESRQDEQELRQMLLKKGISSVAVDFGGEFVPSVKKIIERAVVAAQRQGVVSSNHVGEGAVAGAAHEVLSQIAPKAVGLSVGGKIGIARRREHLCVAIYCGVGVLNLNDMALGMAHRALPVDE